MACCDNPHVIYSFKHRLYDANVNMENISSMTIFNTEDFSDCLAVISSETLHIIGIEDV